MEGKVRSKSKLKAIVMEEARGIWKNTVKEGRKMQRRTNRLIEAINY